MYGEQPQSKSYTGLWIGLAVAAVLLCFGGGAGALYLGGYLGGAPTDGKSPTVPRTPVGQLSRPPQPSATATPPAIITAPDKLGNRAKLSDAEHTALAEQVSAAMRTDRRIADAVAGYYGTADAKKDKVYLAAATLVTPLGNEGFDDMLTQAGLGGMTEVVEVDEGPLGGVAKCGQLKIEQTEAAVCAWADDASFGAVMWYYHTVAQLKPEFIGMRGAVEKRA